MPIGDYENFAACVADQIKKGKSEESAKKICGALQAKVEGKKELDVAKSLGEHLIKEVDTNGRP